MLQSIGNILLQKVQTPGWVESAWGHRNGRVSMTKHRQQRTKVKVKRNRSNTESDLFFPITMLLIRSHFI